AAEGPAAGVAVRIDVRERDRALEALQPSCDHRALRPRAAEARVEVVATGRSGKTGAPVRRHTPPEGALLPHEASVAVELTPETEGRPCLVGRHAAATDDPIALFTSGITTSAISSSERLATAPSTQSMPQ